MFVRTVANAQAKATTASGDRRRHSDVAPTRNISNVPAALDEVHTEDAGLGDFIKVPVNAPGDACEQEADTIASKVMAIADPALVPTRPFMVPPRSSRIVNDKKPIQTKRAPLANSDASLDTSAAVSAAARGGMPLSTQMRAFFEPRFGRDFSQVRVHADENAASAARGVGARAYTVGRDIVFAAGEYAPATLPGRHLLAHELTHVIQQGRVSSAKPNAGVESLRLPHPVMQRKKTTGGDELPDDLDVIWDGDRFTVSFNRVQDEFIVSVTYKGNLKIEGYGTRPTTADLRVDIGLKLLNVTLTEGDAKINLDLYGDGTHKVQVLDQYVSEAGRGRRHDLQLRTLGEARSITSVRVLDPSVKADVKPEPASILPPDVPGEKPVSTLTSGPGGTWDVMRIDGDGDQYKELLVSLRAVENWPDPQHSEVPKRLLVIVKQISSGKSQRLTIDLPKPAAGGALFPLVAGVSDGKLPTIIDLELPEKTARLELYPPTAAGADIDYRLIVAGQSYTIKFPPEKAAPHQVATADTPKTVGGISSVDVTLGAYGDRFRLTLQAQSARAARFGLSALYGGNPVSGLGTTLQLAAPLRLSVLRQGGLSLALDLDGDGKSDLELFDRLDSPQDFRGGSNPERDRDHRIRLVGAAVTGGAATLETSVRDGVPVAMAGPNATDMEAASNAQTVSSLPKQTATFEGDLDRVEIQLQYVRREAVAAAVISRATYDAWLTLSKTMIQLRAERSVKVSSATQSSAANAAAAFYKAFAQEASSANRIQSNWAFIFTTNDYTGMRETQIAGMGDRVAGYGPELEGKLRAGSWDEATTYYNQLVSGLDRWIADHLKDKRGSRDLARTAQYLGAAKTALGAIESKNPQRIQAVFHPEQQFLESGEIAEMPLALYYWRDGSTWHLADLTNPLNTFEDTFAAAPTEKAPPADLFKKLDTRIHFPKGIIHYQLPTGDVGSFHTTAATSWTDYLAYIGLGAAVIGLTLTTFGTGTVAVAGAWVLAASGVITAAGTTAEMIEKWRHGNLDATTAVIDIAQIVASLAGAAAMSSARIVTLAGGAVKAGVPWAGNWARLAVMADRVFVPAVGAKVAADIVTGVALTVETARQLDAIENGNGTRSAKNRAKMLVLSQAGLSLGMLSLSVKGDLGSLKPGRELILYYPPEEDGVLKPPVALVGGEIAPGSLKFSQKDIKGETSEGQTIEDLTNSMRTEGWKGNPLEVVELPDGSKVSLDNRRLVAAQNAGLKEVPIAIHDATDLLPTDQRARFQLKNYAIRKLESGELVAGGSKGVIVYAKGAVPSTYQEAALFRTADQGNLGSGKGKFPLMGRTEQPTIRAVKPGTSPPGDIE